MRVIQKNVNEMPKVVDIDGSLKSMQNIVGGYIETFPLDSSVIIVCNEEGKILDMPVNFIVRGKTGYVEYINGNVFLCRVGTEDFESLTDEDIEYWMNAMSNNV